MTTIDNQWVVSIVKTTAPTELTFLLHNDVVDDFIDEWYRRHGAITLRVTSSRPIMWTRGQPIPTTWP
jgi:hypothetical protein